MKSYTKSVPLYIQVLQRNSLQLIAPFLDPDHDVIVSMEQTRHRLLALSCLCPGASTLIGQRIMIHSARNRNLASLVYWYCPACALMLLHSQLSAYCCWLSCSPCTALVSSPTLPSPSPPPRPHFVAFKFCLVVLLVPWHLYTCRSERCHIRAVVLIGHSIVVHVCRV